LTPIRARVGPFTPVEPRVSVDAIAILRRSGAHQSEPYVSLHTRTQM
jgi:hypothetical protein